MLLSTKKTSHKKITPPENLTPPKATRALFIRVSDKRQNWTASPLLSLSVTPPKKWIHLKMWLRLKKWVRLEKSAHLPKLMLKKRIGSKN